MVWKLPVYNTVHHMLTNPIYAGAYAFGRTGSRVTVEAGRKRVVRGVRKDRGAWDVLILEHHEGYIGWAEFERNQRLIADNANGKSIMAAARSGVARRCSPGWCAAGIAGASCSSATTARRATRPLQLPRPPLNPGGARCISFGGMRVERAVGAEVIARLQPLGIEAAIGALKPSMPDRARSPAKWNWHSSRRATRRPGHGGGTMRWSPTTASSRPSWSIGGMNAWWRCARSKPSARPLRRSQRRRSPRPSASAFLRSAPTSRWPGTAPAPRRRRASGSSAH